MAPIKIAVASGKGGTGKTMVATSLAAVLAYEGDIQFLDCDVEAPNAHLFLNPEFSLSESAVIMVPEINKKQCTLCGICVKECAFNALAMVGEKILVFPQLCHGCGNCSLLCPEKAITEQPKEIGQLRSGKAKQRINYLMGELSISEPMAAPVIRQLKRLMDPQAETTILDSPPGASCSVVATINDADYVLLVTEPTPFGLHDLKQMLGILEQTGSAAGVIINRAGIGDNQVRDYLGGTKYPILEEIPFQERIASGLAQGKLFIDIIPSYRENFKEIYGKICNAVERKLAA